MTGSEFLDAVEETGLYRITFRGSFEPELNQRFENMAFSIHYDQGRTLTTLFGYIKDQDALYEMLNRIKDFRMTLLLVERLDRPGWPIL